MATLRDIALKQYEQTIIVAIRNEIGRNEHNAPIYEWTEHTVEGVLATPQEPTDLPTGKWDAVRQEGHQAKMFCFIPKTCKLNFENAKVKLGGEWFYVLGIPQRYNNPPTRFNMYVILVRETG